MNKTLNRFIGIGLFSGIVILLLLFRSCTFFSEKKPESNNEIALPVYEIDTGTVVLSTNFLGAVEGKFNVEIRPQVQGELLEAYVDEGDYVEKGQKLFKVDPREYQENLNSALAKENVEKANLNNAQTEVERLRPLVENKVMAPVRLETQKSNYKIAQANLHQASAEVANAQLALNRTEITAPVNGYIGRIRKRLGNLVKPGDSEPITVLTDIQEVYVYFPVNESDFSRLQKIDSTRVDTIGDNLKFSDRRVSLILPDGTTYSEAGYIDASSGQVNKKTGTVTLRATFPNENRMLRSGNTVTLVMYDRKQGRIMIPQRATFQLQAETFVMKMTSDSMVVRQLIKIDSDAPNNQYVVKSGLTRGDRILVSGLDKVADNMKVRPLPYHGDMRIDPEAGTQSQDTTMTVN